MAGRRQVLRGLLLGAAGVAVPSALAACGVPSGGHAVVDGRGPSPAAGAPPGGGAPVNPDAARSATDLVDKYLLACAGPLDEQYRTKLADWARHFMTDTL